MFDINSGYSVCLTINNDRFNKLCENFKRVGLKEPIKIEGIKSNKQFYGCNYGHLKMLEYVMEHNFPYCFFYEDDAYPRKDVIQQFNSIIDDIKNNFDVLLFGITGETSMLRHRGEIFDSYNKIKKYSYEQIKKKTLFKSNSELTLKGCRYHGSHAFLVENKNFKSLYNTVSKYIDRLPRDLIFDIDIKNGLDVICTKKLLFTQYKIYPYFYNKEELSIGPLGFHSEYPINF